MKLALIIRSDGHSGHREGHCSPETELADDVPMKGQATKHKVNLTATQQAIHRVGEDAVTWVKNNCKGYKKMYIDLGEVTQGNKHIDNLQTSDMDEQKAIAIDVIKPFLRMCDKARFMQATSWHEGMNGQYSKAITSTLKGLYKSKDIQRMHKLWLDIDGFLIQFSHHGANTSKYKHLEGNAAHAAAKNMLNESLIENERCPDLVFSAHCHKPSKGTAHVFSEGKYHSCTWAVTSPMCGPGAYSRQIANPNSYYVGMNIVQIVDGKLLHIEPIGTKLTDYVLEVMK